MRYFLLREDARSDLWHVAFTADLPLDELRAGLPMGQPTRPARVTIGSAAEPLSDFFEYPCPIVSDAMRRALDQSGVDNVEYFAAEVDAQYAEGEIVANYWVANVVGAVACAGPLPADSTRPKADSPADGPEPPFRIDPARARGFDCFRLAEDRRLVVVSARVARALAASGLRGVVLQAPEDYNGLPVSRGGDA